MRGHDGRIVGFFDILPALAEQALSLKDHKAAIEAWEASPLPCRGAGIITCRGAGIITTLLTQRRRNALTSPLPCRGAGIITRLLRM